MNELCSFYCSLFQFESARFFAERQYYENPNESNLNALAKCYFLQGKYSHVYFMLQGTSSVSNRYMLAHCCIELGKFMEAEKLLLPRNEVNNKNVKLTDQFVSDVPGGPFGLYMLGQVCTKEHRKEEALLYYKKCLELDPTLWAAVVALSDLGIKVDIKDLVKVDTLETALRTINKKYYKSPNKKNEADDISSLLRHRSDSAEKEAAEDEMLTMAAINASPAPNTSQKRLLTLGLSSLSLRAPFTSPGSSHRVMLERYPQSTGADSAPYHIKPHALFSTDRPDRAGGADLRFNDTNNSGDASGDGYHRQLGRDGGYGNAWAQSFAESDSGMSTIGRGNSTERSGSVSEEDESMRTKGKVGKVLFGDTPGLTPIPMASFGYDSGLSENGSHVLPEDSLADDSLVGENRSQCAKSARRVSFGPSARLAFSDMDKSSGDADALSLRAHQSMPSVPSAGGASNVEDSSSFRDPRDPRTAASPSSPNEATSYRDFPRFPVSGTERHSRPTSARRSPTDKHRRDDGFSNDVSMSNIHYNLEYNNLNFDVESSADKPKSYGIASTGKKGIDENDAHACMMEDEECMNPTKFSRMLFDDKGTSVDIRSPQRKLSYDATPSTASTVNESGFKLSGSGDGPEVNLSTSGPQMVDDAGTPTRPRHHYHAKPPVGSPAAPDTRSDLSLADSVNKMPRGVTAGVGHVSSQWTKPPTGANTAKASINAAEAAHAAGDQSNRANGGEMYSRKRSRSIEVADVNEWLAYRTIDKQTASILVIFTKAYSLISQYRCKDCMTLLNMLPQCHYNSGWVQGILGKAHFELSDYKAAVVAMKEVIKLEPYHTRGTELLSSALWMLKRDKELCSLANQVVEIDKFSPETWCVVGNSFSLQREPDTAIKFFERALQISPTFAYAHTLSGHEYIANEDLDKAVACFRHAIRCNDRHYNAWHGLGTIYYRQERLDLAEYHFRKAISLCSSNSVLYCFLCMVLHAQNTAEKEEEAETILRTVIEKDPSNCQLHFQLVHILLAQQRLEEALEQLQTVHSLAPREAPVYTLMGEVCLRLKRSRQAVSYFNMAIDLDPKEAVGLKDVLRSLDDPTAPMDPDDDSFEQFLEVI